MMSPENLYHNTFPEKSGSKIEAKSPNEKQKG
jgi:hypothetical protein